MANEVSKAIVGLFVARIRDGRTVLVARNFDRVRLSDLAKGLSAFVLSCSLLYSRDSKIVAENSDNASNVFRIFDGERGESGFLSSAFLHSEISTWFE